ncbi:MAG TPA: 3-hxdroxyacyl-CoA dehydrogenase [Nannocystis exedens]|nr:3-hxdroxyacyl-CoA dehydrogenase [Nannocystis exedens]
MDQNFVDLRYDIADSEAGIATLTLDRPDARNAYSEAMVDSLCAALDRAEADPAIRGVILTGEGSAFSAGGDLKKMRDQAGMFAGGPVALRRAYIDHIQRIPRRFALFDKPVIAAINGAAIGAGLDLACMCDLRVAADTSKLGSTFVKVGLVPGDGGAYLLARTIGFPRALEMMLSARIIGAQEAMQIGLVHRVVPANDLISTALQIARSIAENPPLAVQLTKRAAYRAWDDGFAVALEQAASYQGMVQRTGDHKEAVAAFLERRKPTFRGE